MSKFENRTGEAMRLGRLSAIGLTFVGILLAAWSLAVAAVVAVPTLLFAAVAAPLIQRAGQGAGQWLGSRKDRRTDRPLVIEGEYKVLNSGTGKG